MISLILLIFAAFFNGFCDSCLNMYETSIFKDWKSDFWNPTTSWKNQFKNGDREQGPKFLGSTTFLVGLTSGWHLGKMLWLNGFILSALLYSPVTSYSWTLFNKEIHPLDFFVFNICWGIVFEVTCRIFRKK